MNRRSFLKLLAAVPLVGRLIKREPVVIDIPSEDSLFPRWPLLNPGDTITIAVSNDKASPIQPFQIVYYDAQGRIVAGPTELVRIAGIALPYRESMS